MKTDSYIYDTNSQQQQRQQYYENGYTAPRVAQKQAPVSQRPKPQPGNGQQKPKGAEKMPKARALSLARTLKQWLVVSSFVGFGTLGGLAALHQINSTTTASHTTTTSSSPTTTSSGASSSSSSSSNSTSQSSSGFFNQQGGNNIGTGNTSQTPASGTHTS